MRFPFFYLRQDSLGVGYNMVDIALNLKMLLNEIKINVLITYHIVLNVPKFLYFWKVPFSKQLLELK